MQKIEPCIWFDSSAVEAAEFYVSIFKDSRILQTTYFDKASAEVSGQPAGSVLTVSFELGGYRLLGMNGGPIFKPNPSISFMVTTEDVDGLYAKLSQGGEVMMELGTYDWSERYAFFKDRFGVSWQLAKGKDAPIIPCILFVGKSLGQAEDAVKHYTEFFKGKIGQVMHYEGKPLVMYAAFHLAGQEFAAMDGEGEHAFGFTEGMSFIVKCKDQEEIDHFWQMSAHPEAEQCGWLKDKFGVSWQIVPEDIDELTKSEKGMAAMLQMKKLDIAALKAAQ